MAVTFAGTMFGINRLARNQQMLEKLTERLATGRRINRAADDAAGLAISEQLTAESRMLDAARRNIDQGQAVLDITDGALNTQQDLLTRAKELAVQASNGILSDQDRATLNGEFRNIMAEIDRIGESTTFNGLDLLGGTTPTETDIQVGTGDAPSDRVDISITASTADSLGGYDQGGGGSLTLNDLDISTSQGANTALDILGRASDQVSSNRGTIGAVSNRLDMADRVAAARIEGTQAARGRLVDLDVASAVTTLENAQGLNQLGAKALTIQNQQRGAILDLLV